MRNVWMGLQRATLVAIGAAVSLPAAAAREGQTADSAQAFLAVMATKVQTRVHFVDAAGRANYVTGKYTGDVKRIKGGAFGKPKETVETLPERAIDKQLADIQATKLEAIDAYGRRNACATRITEVTSPPYDDAKADSSNDTRSFSWTLTYTNEAWKYEPLTRFMNPAQVIDWKDANIKRNPDGSVTVASKGQAFAAIYLTYVAGDLDQADRIEYAMKFLKMSCDETASTGF